MLDLNNTQCIYCKSGPLVFLNDYLDEKAILPDAICCENCRMTYDVTWGVAYLGTFTGHIGSEILSLLEIASNPSIPNWNERESRDLFKKQRLNNSKTPHPVDFLDWIDLIDEYTISTNRGAVLAQHGISTKPAWFDHRYEQSILFRTFTQDIDLRNKEVLDVGAGSGYDALMFLRAGARVTCLEFNPAMAATGRFLYPDLRWFGGSSCHLPFLDCQFDVVTVNSALHHLSNIPLSIEECLRALKPGGTLITIGDPFMGNDSTELQEARIFNNHPSVLAGINEQVPKFHLFTDAFEKHKSILEIRLFTKNVYDKCFFPKEWNFDNAVAELGQSSGAIHFLVKKKSHAENFNQSNVQVGPIRPADYAIALGSESSAISWLVNFVPEQYLNLPILDINHPKFQLLNGWKIYETGGRFRTGYKRARLFYTADVLKGNGIRLSLLVPYLSEYDSPTVEVWLNSVRLCSKTVIRGVWQNLSVSADGLDEVAQVSQNFVLEIRLVTSNQVDDASLFWVRDIRFMPTQPYVETATASSKVSSYELESYGLETLALTTLRDKPYIRLLLSRSFEIGIDIINRLRSTDHKLELIVLDEQKYFYSWIPNCPIVGTYSEEATIIYPVNQSKEVLRNIDLIVSSDDSELDKALLGMLPTQESDIYLVHSNGFAQLIEADKFPNFSVDAGKPEDSNFMSDMDSNTSDDASYSPISSSLSELGRLGTSDIDSREGAITQAETIEGYMAPNELAWLYDHAYGECVEIGSYKGRSSTILGLKLKHTGGNLSCIDCFSEETCRIFQENLSRSGLSVKTYRMRSTEAVEFFRNHSLDFVFIDSSHEYEDTLDEIIEWLPKLKKSGILCGHDYGNPLYAGLTKVVDELCVGAENPTGTIWCIPVSQFSEQQLKMFELLRHSRYEKRKALEESIRQGGAVQHYQSEIARCRTDLAEHQSLIAHTQSELTSSRKKVKRLKKKVQQYKSQLQSLYLENETLRSSRLWKFRDWWIDFKKKIKSTAQIGRYN